MNLTKNKIEILKYHFLTEEIIVYDNTPYVEKKAANAQIMIAKSTGLA